MQFRYNIESYGLENSWNDRSFVNIKILMQNDKFFHCFGVLVHVYKNNEREYYIDGALSNIDTFFGMYVSDLEKIRQGENGSWGNGSMVFDGQGNFECYGHFTVSRSVDTVTPFVLTYSGGSIGLEQADLDAMIAIFKEILANKQKISEFVTTNKN